MIFLQTAFGGRLFTFLVLMVGPGLISVPTGLIASSLTRIIARDNENDSEE